MMNVERIIANHRSEVIDPNGFGHVLGNRQSSAELSQRAFGAVRSAVERSSIFGAGSVGTTRLVRGFAADARDEGPSGSSVREQRTERFRSSQLASR
jgi:hypothetical protein